MDKGRELVLPRISSMPYDPTGDFTRPQGLKSPLNQGARPWHGCILAAQYSQIVALNGPCLIFYFRWFYLPLIVDFVGTVRRIRGAGNAPHQPNVSESTIRVVFFSVWKY